MREMIVGNWRTTLLAVSILLALLMFTQGKISATEFLSILAFFNVAGYLLTRDARTREHRGLADDLADTQAVLTDGRRRRPSRRSQWLGEVAYRLLLVFIVSVLALCFYPLIKDAIADRTTPRTYSPGSVGGYGSSYSPGYSPGYTPVAVPGTQPAPASRAPAHDDEPPHPATGPGPGLAH